MNAQHELEVHASRLVERQRTVHERAACPTCHAPVGGRCVRARAQFVRTGLYAIGERVLKHPHAARLRADGMVLR